MASRRWVLLVRPEDVVWLLLFSALAVASPSRYPAEIVLLSCMALLQVLEPRIPMLSTGSGNAASVLAKLLLCYLLMLATGGVNSSYYPILLVPVVSAATSLGVVGAVVFTILASGSYASFLLLVDWTRYTIPPEEVREL